MCRGCLCVPVVEPPSLVTMAAPVDMAQLEATMADFLKPDNAVRKAAEARLKKMLRKPSAAGLLLQACTGSAFPQVRRWAHVGGFGCDTGMVSRDRCVVVAAVGNTGTTNGCPVHAEEDQLVLDPAVRCPENGDQADHP